MAAVQRLAGHGPFLTGPVVDTYNQRTLAKLAGLGLRRRVMPVELSRDTLAAIQADRPANAGTELFAYGRLPLPLLARCFTTRAHNLPKYDCRLRCPGYPDGMLMRIHEDAQFLALDGIQTRSALTCGLLTEIDDIGCLGVDVLRISPQSRRTPSIIDTFADVLRTKRNVHDASAEIVHSMPSEPCSGYWHSRPGLSRPD